MCLKLIVLSSVTVLSITASAHSDPHTIEVLSAEYGDGQGHTCEPNISICNGQAECEFLVDDNLCSLVEEAGSARNLEVTFSCGVPLQDKAVAAAKGTKIKLDCQVQ
jgi:hypothetical protein